MIFDSDSYMLESGVVEKAMPFFNDPEVALVQFRTVAQVFQHEGPRYRILSSSVSFYDAFVHFMDSYGWSPFLGHNAMLRVSAIRQVKGFSPGELADDIDFSVKLRLGGYRIKYARDILCAERHPSNYAALRRRTRKWAYGCTQVIRKWGTAIVRSPSIRLNEKITFFLTVGYYHFQLLLLLYLGLFYLLLPFDRSVGINKVNLAISAVMILLFTFVPSISYFARGGRLRKWPKTAILWGLTYGSQDWVILSGVWQSLTGIRMWWTPTNTGTQKPTMRSLVPEVLAGVLIVVGALSQSFVVLLLPTTMLFAGKFLMAPFLDRLVFDSKRS
jgi:cellulose synthase/poly-beta-1,6-N-acetylglucosamine synthase-like glycosyltransferase